MATIKTMDVMLKASSCIVPLNSRCANIAATRQLKPTGPAKKLAVKISAIMNAAQRMSQMIQADSMSKSNFKLAWLLRIVNATLSGMVNNHGEFLWSFTGSSAFLRIFRFSNSTTTAKAMAK